MSVHRLKLTRARRIWGSAFSLKACVQKVISPLENEIVHLFFLTSASTLNNNKKSFTHIDLI